MYCAASLYSNICSESRAVLVFELSTCLIAQIPAASPFATALLLCCVSCEDSISQALLVVSGVSAGGIYFNEFAKLGRADWAGFLFGMFSNAAARW